MAHPRRISTGAAAIVGIAALALTACGGGSSNGAGGDGGNDGDGKTDCAGYEQYGDLSGETVTVYTSIVTPEDTPHIESYKPFEECTGAKIEYEGSRQFEAQLPVRIRAGNAPDIAYIPQPGLLQTLVTQNPGAVKAAGELANKNVDEYYNEAWKGYGSVDGTFYAVPVGANAKSFVWYSPSTFADNGYEVPETWDALMDLTKKIAADHGDDYVKPWCVGIESGPATGWPATDWLEDAMLRTVTPEEYDQWVTGDLAFNDAKVLTALNMVGDIVKNPDYVNGGLGGVQSIATAAFGEAGLPILEDACFLHRQASFFQANWPEDVKVAEDGDVFAFYLPSNGDDKPVLGGGEFAAAFSDRPAVQAFQAYLASPEWVNEKAKVSGPGWLSANSGLDPANLESPIDQLSFELLTDENTIFRFDASDLMPGEVGAGTFWTGMTEWIATDKDSQRVLDDIAASWPKS
ncbi:MAG TPA: carbohydrate ABC transporter substrate-binding protein [Intrasporangiaceae bacterium]|nr:carbohydrate ABC transporter substrate-binding protein [Intrasporangiaceae bacterium]